MQRLQVQSQVLSVCKGNPLNSPLHNMFPSPSFSGSRKLTHFKQWNNKTMFGLEKPFWQRSKMDNVGVVDGEEIMRTTCVVRGERMRA